MIGTDRPEGAYNKKHRQASEVHDHGGGAPEGR